MNVPHALPSARDQDPYGGFAVARGFNQHKRRTSSYQPTPPITPCNVVCTGIRKGNAFGRVTSHRIVRLDLILLRRLKAAGLDNCLRIRNSQIDEPLGRRGQFPGCLASPYPKLPCRYLEERVGDASNQSGWRLRP